MKLVYSSGILYYRVNVEHGCWNSDDTQWLSRVVNLAQEGAHIAILLGYSIEQTPQSEISDSS